MADFEILHAALFAGIGAGSKGFNDARPDIGTACGRFRCTIWVRDVAVAMSLPGEVQPCVR